MSGNRSRDTHCKSLSRLYRLTKYRSGKNVLPIETSGDFLSSPFQIFNSFFFYLVFCNYHSHEKQHNQLTVDANLLRLCFLR